ncbi:aminotransferase [Streptomyces diastatochromogenes]|uniref:Aminotransferase n=1 Tax=Streptomyces diastatochromogenes TaxID=42236 RepID=A0A233S1Z9_STRDA|nr:aminotransferase [Streptomyces diastatochromogenes]MCZ0991533.1 aminotransferase [Streptomyces diastatochromogenes]OXY89603.1 aminotransferase [Streptomyces diastatochromogenes]
MKIREFEVEQWMNEYEETCRYNLAETCVRSLTTGELLELSGRREQVFAELDATPLTYGPIPGSSRLRRLVADLYATQRPDNVLITHGAIGANALVHATLVDPGDHIVAIVPTYQQHYSIPDSYGARVDRLPLREEHGWLPDLDELDRLVTADTKLIAVNNPNNPTGALIDEAGLARIAHIADRVGAWVLCDEVYRGIDQDGDGFTASIADLYERGISTGSMSKPFSLAGLRLGWIVGPTELLKDVATHRDYTTISVGRVDDLLACVALENKDAILARSHRITRTNLAILDEWVAGRDDVTYVRPASGTTALLRYQAPIGSYEFCTRLLQETGVMFTPGAAFDIERTVRIGFADDTQTLRTGLRLVGRFLDRLTQA